ncbi:hypothetical protein PV327_002402 [Microctonus hyperodae]|uniref:Uncharacterized protein n=1 Tax=Microctonus hyperodae TaxID=165561 RepID=A0AA39KP57_MICHY|nr:hypothetical protein PV327_002402 [Microctonus hyperodae]
MNPKFVFTFVYLAIVAVTLSNSSPKGWFHLHHSTHTNKSHDLIVGSRTSDDSMALEQNIIKSGNWLKKNVIKQSFNISESQIITQIKALDQDVHGHGAHVSLIEGGPGYNNVSLKFKSQRDHGINFKIVIFAKKE